MKNLEQKLELEQIFKKINTLKKDLRAKIVVQEEKGHWESTLNYDSYTGLFHPSPYLPPRFPTDREIEESKRWVIDESRITKPDTQKRNAAKTELQKIYESCDWYSARYEAGKTIRINDDILRNRSYNWILEMTEQQDETTTKNAIKVLEDLKKFYKILGSKEERCRISRMLNIPRDIFLRDELRKGTIFDKEELKQIYNSKNKKIFYSDRKKAGEALGYSELKISAQKRPIRTILITIPIAGVIVVAAAYSAYGYYLIFREIFNEF